MIDNKKLLLVPIIIILLILVIGLCGCTELVKTESYDLKGTTVVLQGSALITDELLEDKVGFAFDDESHDIWDDYQRKDIDPKRTWKVGNRLYFEVEIGGLEMGQAYYFRSGAYYHSPMEPPTGPITSPEVSFVCGSVSDENNVQFAKIDNNQDQLIELLTYMLEKNPQLIRYLSNFI